MDEVEKLKQLAYATWRRIVQDAHKSEERMSLVMALHDCWRSPGKPQVSNYFFGEDLFIENYGVKDNA